MTSTIVVQKPAGKPEHLFLLLHGVGASAHNMVPLGHFIAGLFPRAAVICVDGIDPSDISAGRQWFSVRGVTEENRVARVRDAMPGFVAAMRSLQRENSVDAAHTTLVGFSQGGIMALESTLLPEPPAARIVALSSRFAQLPEHMPDARIHLLHGEIDSVIPCTHTLDAAARLHRLGAQATADVIPGTDHEITAATMSLLASRLGGKPAS